MVDTKDEFTRYVITRLGRTANRDDLIMEVCHKKGLDWDDAEAWINSLEEEHSRAIGWRQAPAFIALCAIAGLGGLYLAARAFYAMILPFLAYQHGLDQYSSLTIYAGALWSYVPMFIAGASLSAGAVVGLVNIFTKLRYNETLDT